MPPSTQLPIGISDAIPKRAWKKKKAYGLADVAGLATAVITQNDLAVKERLLPRSSQHKAKAESGVMRSACPRAREPATISHTFPTRKARQTLTYHPLQLPLG
jgi:hypothetical protein